MFLTALRILGVLVIAAATACADTIDFRPTPINLGDLNHSFAYSWRIDGVDLAGETITEATLTISRIRNYNNSANILFIHLLDTAMKAGVGSYKDDPSGFAPARDDFMGHNPLVAGGTGNILLTEPSFTTIPKDFAYSFTGPQLATLIGDIRHGGDFALGFDPDCHFFNKEITLTLTTAPANVAEPSSMVLLGSCLFLAMTVLRRKQRPRA